MNNHNAFLASLLLLSSLVYGVAAVAEESPAGKATAAPGSHYTDKGADTCIKCHDEDSEFPVFSIFKTKHAQKNDLRTPFGGTQCEACHGPGAEHSKKVPEGTKQAPIVMFGAKAATSPEKQNKFCLDCHEGNARIAWKASNHEGGNLACASCHKVHAPRDAVLAKTTQPDVCYTCHKKERADFLKPSTHPVATGLLACSECHSPHGSNAGKLLAKSTVNQTCYTCHAEKRGPFLWEHAPVSEDCTLCHSPHGSVHAALLKKSAPLLCQQCHAAGTHPSEPLNANSLPGGSLPGLASKLLLGGCANCHSQVHGSNHPSGPKLMR